MKRLILFIGLLLLASFLAACGDLAGDVEIVGQMPTSFPQSTNLTIPNTVPDLLLGAEVFAANCVRCHGATGAGDGEFVLSGQISEIPNFTDAAQHQGRTAAEYFTTVTQGRLEKLMPPFGGSLSDEERWAVANYVLTLAGTSPSAPEATESANIVIAPETTAASPEVTPDVHSSVTGSITGRVIQGTAGGTIPVGSLVRLRVMDMLGTESSFEATVNADGSYLFPNIFILESSAYRVSIEYSGGTFSSEFAVGTPANPNMILDILIYETTDDATVLQINVVLTQIDMINENSLQVWQMINISNLSDRVYIHQNANGRSVSVAVPVPAGFSLSPENDLDRFTYDSVNGLIYDTRPVVPFVEHNFHLIYTVPFTGSFTVNQRFDYAFSGPYEAYADSSLLNLTGNSWTDLDNQTLGDISYAGIGVIEGRATGQNLQFTINRGFQINRTILGYGLMLLGLLFIIGASLLYWRNRHKPEQPAIDSSKEAELMKAIADLDERFESKQISKKVYERERKALKARLVDLMKVKS